MLCLLLCMAAQHLPSLSSRDHVRWQVATVVFDWQPATEQAMLAEPAGTGCCLQQCLWSSNITSAAGYQCSVVTPLARRSELPDTYVLLRGFHVPVASGAASTASPIKCEQCGPC